MSDPSPLRRKIGDRRPEAAPQILTPERVWRRSVTHGLMRSISLEVTVGKVEHSSVPPDAVGDRVGDGALVVLLDGPAGYGVAILSSAGLAAMIEVQTMGRVQTRPPGPREVTALDAAMVADALDRVLAVQETLVAEMGQRSMVSGYRFAMRIENLREIALSLDDAPHDCFSIAFEAGPGGPRAGQLDIVLPRLTVAAAGCGSRSEAWARGLERRLMGAEVTLRAVLAQSRMAVADLQGLRPGDTVPLGSGALGRVALVAPGGQVMCRGRLGQSGGQKAVRLGTAPQDFAEAAPGPPPAGDAVLLPGDGA